MNGELLLITGSPRKNGVTARMSCFAKEAWLEGGGRLSVFDAYSIAPKPCTHCGHCKTKPSCIYDDLNELDTALKRASALVIASPVYVMGFPAPLKAILDRMQRYFEEKFTLGNPCPIPLRKPALFLAACGAANNGANGSPAAGSDAPELSYMKEQLIISFRLMNARLAGTYLMRGTDTLTPDYEQARRDIAALVNEALITSMK
ncbi:MAG: flavodoxin family protein [Spirochaetaceae bacterium]|jgi:multimeric flavodoxin WrbA|nr:flavodoxin family protein [Spirochaetaceae bacterium]